MVTDHFFHIGTSHSNLGIPCQDHALSGIEFPASFGPVELRSHDEGSEASVVISDGCSGAGEGFNPDIGARIITQCYLRHAKECCVAGFIPSVESFVSYLRVHIPSIVSFEDMLASLIGVTHFRGKIKVNWIGDGVVVVKAADGSYKLWSLAFPFNSPLYPVTLADTKAQECYRNYMKGRGLGVTEVDFQITNTGAVVFEGITKSEIAMENVCEHGFSLLFEEADVQDVFIFSDGLEQFRMEEETWSEVKLPVPARILEEFLTVKGYHGSFAKRRCLRAFDSLKKDGITPSDDFSMGALHVTSK